jgi:predicted enzyme related to lactoylglutathione lyase
MPARKKPRRPAKKKPARPTPTRTPKRKKIAPGRKKPKKRAAPRRAAKPARRSARPAGAKPAPPPPAPRNAIGFVMQHVDYTTHDPEAIRRFYVETLGFANAELDPGFNYLFIQTGGTSSLGFMPPMPGMGMPSPVKEPTLYFLVEDVDRTYAELSVKGVHFEGPPADMPWGHRVVATVDPEGRRVMLAMPQRPNA